MSFEDREHVVDGRSPACWNSTATRDPVRQAGQEVVQPVIVALLARRQLNQQRSSAGTQFVQAAANPSGPQLRLVQLLGMGQSTRCLDREREAWR